MPAAAAARAVAQLALGVGEPLERGRRDEHGQRELGAENGGRGRDLADVDEHARAQLPRAKAADVGAQRVLVAGAARVVGIRPGLEPLARRLLEVGDVERLHPRRIRSVSPSSSSDAALSPDRRTATAAPRSRRSSPSTTGAEAARHRRDVERRCRARTSANLLEPAVAERALGERRDRALGRGGVELGTVAPSPTHPLLAEPGRSAPRASSSVSTSLQRRARSGPPRSAATSESSSISSAICAGGRARSSPCSGRPAPRARPCGTSVCAKPCTVASGVRRSWQASETRRAKRSSFGSVGISAWRTRESFYTRPPGLAVGGAARALARGRRRACRRRSGSATASTRS